MSSHLCDLPRADIPWEILSDEEFWGYFENRRYRAGDRYLTGAVLKEGDREIGRLLYPDARKHDREFWEDYMLDRGEFALPAGLAGTTAKADLDLDDAADWEGLEVPPRRWLLEGWLPIGEAALLTGAGSVGKSLVSQQLAATAAAGQPFMGLPIEQVTTLYITCEDSQEELQRRHKAIVAAMGRAPARGACYLKSWKGKLDLELATFDGERQLRPTKRFEALRQAALQTCARLIVLDNTSHLMGGDENVKREVAAFVNLLNGLAAEIDGVVLLLGHPNKTGLNNPGAGDANQFGGSVAWENQVRSRMFMAAPSGDDPDARELSNPKANYSSKGNKLEFRWHRGAFVRDEDLPADYAAELTATIKASGDNNLFLACLAERNKQRRHVSEKPTAQNFAPKIFATMPESKGIGRKRLTDAMDRLFRIEQIERGFIYRDTAEGKDIHGLREASNERRQDSGNLSGNLPETYSGNLRKPAENDRKHTPLYPTGNSGAASWAAAPDDDDLDWGEEAAE